MKRSAAVSLVFVLLLSCKPPLPPWSAAPTTAPSATPSPDPPTPLSPTPTSNGAILVVGIDIAAGGSDDFLDQTEEMLLFLQGCAPDALATADQYVAAIVESDRSGMDVAEGTFSASETTAFAPGYSQPAQVYWFAGSLVHDARHRWQHQTGTPTSWDSLPLEQRQGNPRQTGLPNWWKQPRRMAR